MRVRDAMSRNVYTVKAATPIKDLWHDLLVKSVNAMPVIDKTGKLTGIITKEDLLSALYPDYSEYITDFTSASDFRAMEDKISEIGTRKAGDFMNRKVIFTREGTMLMRALSRMIARSVNQLPVLSDNDKVVGMITKGDVFRVLFKNRLKRVITKGKAIIPGRRSKSK